MLCCLGWRVAGKLLQEEVYSRLQSFDEEWVNITLILNRPLGSPVEFAGCVSMGFDEQGLP